LEKLVHAHRVHGFRRVMYHDGGEPDGKCVFAGVRDSIGIGIVSGERLGRYGKCVHGVVQRRQRSVVLAGGQHCKAEKNGADQASGEPA
jgi:hypothetical protein